MPRGGRTAEQVFKLRREFERRMLAGDRPEEIAPALGISLSYDALLSASIRTDRPARPNLLAALTQQSMAARCADSDPQNWPI